MVSAKVVDFTNVKDGGNFNKSRIPAGDYLAKIIKVEDAVSKKDQAFQFLFTIQIVKRPSSKLPYYCKLQENQLWKLRNILIAAGKGVPKSKQKVDPNQIVNKLIGVTVEDSEFDSDKGLLEQSEISGVFPAAELGDVDSPTDDVDEDEEDEDEAAADDLDDMDDLGTETLEEEEPEDEAAGDEWDAITDRLELRKALKRLAPEIKTSTAQSDDDIRDLIREAAAKAAKPKAAAKPAAKAKPKAADIADEELEGLDLDDL